LNVVAVKLHNSAPSGFPQGLGGLNSWVKRYAN
jgi:hypothetical protein